MTPIQTTSVGKRSASVSKRASLSMAERRSIAETALDIFAVLRSRRKPWRVPELANSLNFGKRSIYNAVATGQLPAIHIGTSLRINPADALAWVKAGTTGLRSSQEAA